MSGVQIQHVDALNQNRVLVFKDCAFNQTLFIKQNSDPEKKEITKMFETFEHKQFKLRNGLIYRKSKERLLFYVPPNMCNRVIR